ncbi:MAG: hypothetical protein ACK4YP_26715, partial [Myxococcota bacterium]
MMSPTAPELLSHLAAGLAEEARRRGERLDVLLNEVERLGEWAHTAAPDELRGYLAEQRRDRAIELAELLLSWRRIGGRVALSAGETVATPPVSAPAPDRREAANVLQMQPPEDSLEDELPTERIANGKPALPSPPVNLASAEALAGLKNHVETGGGFRVQAP